MFRSMVITDQLADLSVMTIDLALTYIRHLVSIGPDNAPSILDS